MCYKGKCMYCLEVETGSLIFAILNVMATSLGSVVSLGGLVYTNFIAQAAIERADVENDSSLMAGALMFGLASNVLFAVLTVVTCIAFSFAVVLIVGLCKRKANLVKCYFVYGVMKIVLGLIAFVGVTVNSYLDFGVIFLVLIIYSLYALILVMVRMTYKKFETEIPFTAFSNQMSTIQKF